MVPAEFFCLFELGFPVVKFAVQAHRIRQLEQIEIAVLVEGVEEFPVKESRPAGQGRGHGTGRKHQGFPTAFEQVVLQDAAQPEAGKRDGQEHKGD